MYNKIVLLSAVLCVFHLAAMDVATTKPISDGMVTLQIEDEEVELPIRYAKLLGIFIELQEDFLGNEFPLPNTGLSAWRLIENQLPRVYRIITEEGNPEQLKQEIIVAYQTLESKQLVDLIREVDYLDITLLMDIVVEVITQATNVQFKDLASLPEHLLALIISHKVHVLLGPIPVRHQRRLLNGQPVRCLCVIDDTTIVAPTYARNLAIFDPQGDESVIHEGREIFAEALWVTCEGHELFVNDLCGTRDGIIVSASDDKTVRLWDRNGDQLAICRGHEGGVTCVCVTKDGTIVSGSKDKTVRVWDMQGNQLAVYNGHTEGVNSVNILKDTIIVSSSYDKTLHFCDLQGEPLALGNGHDNNIRTSTVIHDNNIVTAAYDNTVRLWNSHGDELAVYDYKQIGSPVCILEDGKVLVTSHEEAWSLCDTKGQKLLVHLAVSYYEKDWPHCACFLNRNTLLIGSQSGLYVYDVTLLRRLETMNTAQAEKIWQLFETVVEAETAHEALEGLDKEFAKYNLTEQKQQEYWPQVEKILAE